MTTSINGWPILPAGNPMLKTELIPGTTMRLTMHKTVLPLFLALAHDYKNLVHALRVGECGAYSYRQAKAAAAWSDHASGTAVDLNWNHEGAAGPHGGMATMTPAQITACAHLKTFYRIVIWGGDKARGGDYGNPAYWDPMHYAIRPGITPAQAAATIKALKIAPNGVRTR